MKEDKRLAQLQCDAVSQDNEDMAAPELLAWCFRGIAYISHMA